MPAGLRGRRAVFFLVEISMAEAEGDSAIFFRKFVVILKGVKNYFRGRGLTSFPQAPAVGLTAGTCGGANCGFAAIRAEGEVGGGLRIPPRPPKARDRGYPGGVEIRAFPGLKSETWGTLVHGGTRNPRRSPNARDRGHPGN